jgi:hypothetical protein
MKNWWNKFKISNALNAGRPYGPNLRRAIARSEELRQFVSDCARAESRLKGARPAVTPPDSLHRDILQAVNETRAGHEQPDHPAKWRPAYALAVGVLSVAVVMWVYFPRRTAGTHRGAGPELLPAASTALVLGESMLRELPESTLSPMADEWVRLGADWERAQEFLLASLP